MTMVYVDKYGYLITATPCGDGTWVISMGEGLWRPLLEDSVRWFFGEIEPICLGPL